jgi:high-affinity Fe2+/Pb2+ permease
MDTAGIISLLQESLFMVLVFVGFLAFAISAGRQSITNVILGLYFALLISIEFPYYEMILGSASSEKMKSIVMLIVFGIFTLGATILFARLMPREYSEGKFEGFWKKILLACAATVLVMAFSYHALPVTDIITPGSPIQYLFGSKSSFFWWLLAPLGILFIA